MTARRNSARLAMAVSSILAAPALVSGLGLAAGLLIAPEARAQETTAQMAGYVTDGAGNPVAGAQVNVLHAPSGTGTSATTNASGQFTVTGLRVGGPYSVSVSAAGFQASGIENVYTELGRRANVSVSLYPTTQLAEVQITAASERATAIGVGTEFSAQKLAEMPSIGRDMKDTLRIDPKAWVDPTNSGAIEVAGVNSKYNSITVDGVRQGDDFGINNSGYPTLRTPVSIDAVEAISLLTAPFDVQYSAFRGSSINIVTKSGTNEFHGSAFYYKYDEGLTGDTSQGAPVNIAQFDRKTFGATFGGPIIQDRLFFFASYEKLEETKPQRYGPAGSGASNEVARVSQDDYDRIVSIAQDVYQFDVGARFDSLPESDEKILAKIDWNINDNHRASLAYQRTEGNVLVQSNNFPPTGLSAPSNWYNLGINLESRSFQLFSNWNDRFATEVKFARKEVETTQASLRGTDFAQMRIDVLNPSGVGTGQVFIGPDNFRHANALTNDLDQIKFKGDLFLGDHTVSFGYEKEKLDIFNLFVQDSEGVYVFSSIDDFQNRRAQQLDYQNAYNNNKFDGAASFGYSTDSVYLQDKWQVTDNFQLQYGVRFDKWSSDDKQRFNQKFQTRYGFSNQESLDGRDLLMPRFGFNWQLAESTVVHGGVGLFGGGTPNVWVSNTYTNNGVTLANARIVRPSSGIEPLLDGVNGFTIPQAVQDRVTANALAGDGQSDVIAPDFEIPSQWRFNLGLEHTFASDWRFSADVMYSTVKDEIFYQDVRLFQSGTAPDGRPIYSQTGPSSRGSGTQDFVLSNTSEGRALIFTADMSKSWVTRAGIIDLYVGYGHQDVLDVNPGTSSRAQSNWDSLATEDPNNPKLSTSNYEIEHRFTLAFNWRKDFFENLFTSAGLFVERRSGRPYSYTFGNGTTVFGDPRQFSRQRQLFYVPAGPNDVLFENGLTWAAMESFIEASGLTKYMGQIAPRNAFNSPWITIADLRLAQEIPTFIKGTRGVLTLDIENVANLIDSDWGRLGQRGFPYVAPVLNGRIVTDPSDSTKTKYVYRPISGTTPSSPFINVYDNSVWKIQLGVRFEF